jgi:hypothetical protein
VFSKLNDLDKVEKIVLAVFKVGEGAKRGLQLAGFIIVPIALNVMPDLCAKKVLLNLIILVK